MSSLGDGFHRLRPYYQELRHGTAYLAFAMIVVIWLGALFHLISARDQLFDSIRQNSANLAHAFEQDVVHSLSEVKMRALGPLSVPLIEAFKASAVPIGLGDLYTAAATGLVDVQDNSLSVFRLVKLQEVHKFILLSRHSYSVGVLGINNAFYIQLSPDERAAVDAAARKAIAFNRESSRKAEQEAMIALKVAGIAITELTPEQKRELQRVTKGPVIDWLKTQISVPGLIDEALLAVQTAR
jgi:TRAP-type C4-dicarboxylate transport system substrate-binding protein